MQDKELVLDNLGKRIIKLNQDFMKVRYDAASTGIRIGLGILTAGYFYRPEVAVVVRALSTYLLPFIYLKDLKL